MNQDLPLVLEIDSLALKMMVDDVLDCPWNNSMILRKIKEFRNSGNIQINHTLREGNTLADFLTNQCLVLQVHLSSPHSRRCPEKLKYHYLGQIGATTYENQNNKKNQHQINREAATTGLTPNLKHNTTRREIIHQSQNLDSSINHKI